MQSSFRKLNIEKMDSLPTRRVHVRETEVVSPSEVPINPREVLVSLEKRLTNLKQSFTDVYADQFELGKQTGYKQGYEDGRNQASQMVEVVSAELQAWRKEKEVFAQRYREEIVDLVITVCRKLLLEELTDPETINRLVEEGLASLNPPLEAVIYCNPAIIDALRQASERFSVATRGSVDIIADPLLVDSAVRIQAENSILEINLMEELKEIAAELRVDLGP